MTESERPLVVKHLEFIQITIVRMAANSFIIKGWAITLTAAILAFMVSENRTHGVGLALLPILMFWGLDGYYLRQERLFRKLYDTVRVIRHEDSVDFSLDTSQFDNNVQSWFRTCLSRTVWVFFTPLVFVTIAVWWITYLAD